MSDNGHIAERNYNDDYPETAEWWRLADIPLSKIVRGIRETIETSPDSEIVEGLRQSLRIIAKTEVFLMK